MDEGAVIASRLEDYFGKDEDLDENERFLKDYLHREGWRDKDSVRRRGPPLHHPTLLTFCRPLLTFVDFWGRIECWGRVLFTPGGGLRGLQDRVPTYGEVVGDMEEDEEDVEAQERFEAHYNFRFEEGAGNQVEGHARCVY